MGGTITHSIIVFVIVENPVLWKVQNYGTDTRNLADVIDTKDRLKQTQSTKADIQGFILFGAI